MKPATHLTEQELESLHKGVVGAGLLVSASDRGFVDSFKEAGALARHLADARQNTSSALVREIAARRGTGFGLTSSPQEVEAETLEALRTSIATLRTKAPDEIGAYRSFVLEVAESVAAAAAGGAAVESETLEKIKAALGDGADT